LSRLRLTRGCDRLAQSWKNGGGETSQIAVHPPAATMDDFEWRVSMARVTHAGPFSHFTGVDRTLAVIEGTLSIDFGTADGDVVLGAGSQPLRFPGDTAVMGRPLGSPVMDLNLMTRRGRWTGTIERRPGPVKEAIKIQSSCVIVLFTGNGTLYHEGRAVRMNPWDTAQVFEADSVLGVSSREAIFVLRLSASGSVGDGRGRAAPT